MDELRNAVLELELRDKSVAVEKVPVISTEETVKSTIADSTSLNQLTLVNMQPIDHENSTDTNKTNCKLY